jgi:Uma2 family endonuclease
MGDHPVIKPYKPWKKASEESGDNVVKEPEAAYNDSGRQFSLKDYLDVEERSGFRHEYYKGTVFAMAGASFEHNRIVFNLTISLGIKMQGKSCDIFGSDQRVHIPANSLYTYPDLTIVCDQPALSGGNMSLINPGVIIEVLSPTTKDYDRTTKFTLYRDIPTFQEYILIDSRSVLVEHHYKNENGEWICQTWDKFTDTLAIKMTGVSVLLSDIYKNTGILATH